MKILVLGVGGIGSFLIEGLYEYIEQGLINIDLRDLAVADGDVVEVDQVRPYQNFSLEDVGLNKAEVLGKRYDIRAIKERITINKQLKPFDLIVMAVDNEKTRELVIKSGKEFLDLRATGRTIFVAPKTDDSLKFVDIKDLKEYSCQNDKNKKQEGHKITAHLGLQMILNSIRGIPNKIITMTI